MISHQQHASAGATGITTQPNPAADRKVDLWDEAIKTLPPELRANYIVPNADRLSALNKALDVANEKKEQCANKQWKYHRQDGRVIVFREVFARVVSWIEKVKSIGDFVVSVIPSYATIPWAALSLVLEMAVSDSKRYATVLDGIDLMTHLLAKCAVVEEVYIQPSSKAVELLEQAIVKLYAKILLYLDGARQYYTRGTVSRMVRGVMQSSEHGIFDLVDEVTLQQTTVDELARLVDAERLRLGVKHANTMSAKIEGDLEQLRKMLRDMEQPFQASTDQVTELRARSDKTERREILEWVSKMPYTQHQDSARKDRLPSSGLWLLQRPEYEKWRRSKCSSLLWLHGIPGSGKSKLLSLVVDSLRENEGNRQTTALAYVFCTRNTAERQRSDPGAIVRCVLRQLSCLRPPLPVREAIVRKYHQLQEEGFDPRELSIEESSRLIMELAADYPTTIVIDALDECDADRRHELLEVLEAVLQASGKPVKVLVSSRDSDEDISSRLTSLAQATIDSSGNKDDIQSYIDLEIGRAIVDKRLLGGAVSNDLQRKLVAQLVVGAQSM